MAYPMEFTLKVGLPAEQFNFTLPIEVRAKKFRVILARAMNVLN
jgi:hypothetical protein